jgi:ubiquinone/menaquinone biosynthesis C-methylase UbiE
MQGLLTIIVDNEDRNKIIQEAYRVLKSEGCLYIVEFGQTWHSDLYRERYLRYFPITKEEGSILVCNEETGEVEYFAHHYTEKELVFLLVNNSFKIDYFKTKEFVTRSGNRVNGFITVSKKLL